MDLPIIDIPPRVFISFSGDDRERFVDRFGRRLRADGIDAFLSFWEIGPGDSLVQKIFAEGLDSAFTVIVVLSETSVTKPWVVAELDAAVLKRIEDKVRIIPVKIDDLTVPLAIRMLNRVTFKNLNNEAEYEEKVREIVNQIHGVSDKPSIGTPPRYIRPAEYVFEGLNRIENKVMALLCSLAYQARHRSVTRDSLIAEALREDLDEGQVNEALETLMALRRIDGKRFNGPEWLTIEVPPVVVDASAAETDEGYRARRDQLIADLIEQGKDLKPRGLFRSVEGVAPEELGVVMLMLEALSAMNMVRYSAAFGRGNPPTITGVSPLLARSRPQ